MNSTQIDEQNRAVEDFVAIPDLAAGMQRWSRLSEQIFRVDKWSVCRG
jgi:hypothetical protein